MIGLGFLKDKETLDGGEFCLEVWLNGSAACTAVKPHLKAQFAFEPHPDFTAKFKIVWCGLHTRKYGTMKINKILSSHQITREAKSQLYTLVYTFT